MSEADKKADRRWYSSGDLKLFAIKTCLVAIVTIFTANWIIESSVQTLEDSTARTIANFRAELTRTPIGGEHFWEKIERELDRAADGSSDLPPGKK